MNLVEGVGVEPNSQVVIGQGAFSVVFRAKLQAVRTYVEGGCDVQRKSRPATSLVQISVIISHPTLRFLLPSPVPKSMEPLASLFSSVSCKGLFIV